MKKGQTKGTVFEVTLLVKTSEQNEKELLDKISRAVNSFLENVAHVTGKEETVLKQSIITIQKVGTATKNKDDVEVSTDKGGLFES